MSERRGFTFVETIIVLVIIALGAALAVPMIEGGFEAREVRRAARQIAATMHWCRNEAVALGQPQALTIDALQNGIHTSGWERWARLTDRAVIADVEGGSDLGDGTVRILFFPNGSTSGARVLVASRRNRFENRLLIELEPLLGTVRVRDTST